MLSIFIGIMHALIIKWGNHFNADKCLSILFKLHCIVLSSILVGCIFWSHGFLENQVEFIRITFGRLRVVFVGPQELTGSTTRSGNGPPKCIIF